MTPPSPSSPIEGRRWTIDLCATLVDKTPGKQFGSKHLSGGRVLNGPATDGPVEVMPVEEHEAAMKAPDGDGHRVEIEFDGFGPSIKLLHPQGGCPLPEGVCEECGRDLQDPKSKSCIGCDVMVPGWCWVQDWVENDGYELLHGKVTLPVEPEWDGDSARLHVQQPATSTQPNPTGDREPTCVHSKTVLGCASCLTRVKNQAGRYLRERDGDREQLQELLEAVSRMKAAETRAGHPYSARHRLYAVADRIRDEQKAGS